MFQYLLREGDRPITRYFNPARLSGKVDGSPSRGGENELHRKENRLHFWDRSVGLTPPSEQRK